MSLKIFGIGVDIVKHSRIEKIILSSHSKRFVTKVLNKIEIVEFNSKNDVSSQTAFLASRY
jgi:phosphopantetheinyl transferase (holo-ACP synthase)